MLSDRAYRPAAKLQSSLPPSYALGAGTRPSGFVFADLALAQLSALGATVAFALGYAPLSPAGFAYAFAFTTLGAVLIMPAVIGAMFSRAVPVVLAIAWSTGILASALGLGGSFVLDLPTGAAMVMAFVLMLELAGLAKALVVVPAAQRRHHWRIAGNAAAVLALVAVFASSLWLLFNPAADQPLLALVERTTGLGPASFLDAGDRQTYEEAMRDAARFQQEVAALNAKERAARVGTPLSDEEVRRVASYQQSFNEMARGELFVEDVLRAKARRRERWIVGLPAAALALAGLVLLARSWRRRA